MFVTLMIGYDILIYIFNNILYKKYFNLKKKNSTLNLLKTNELFYMR